MDSPTPFQLQHPLSPRKLMKKMLGSLLVSFFIALVLAICGGLVVSLLVVSYSSTTNLWGVLGLNILIFFMSWGAILLLFAWYYKTYIARYYYDVGSQFITIKKGVFSPAEIHVQYQKIQDVYVDQDIMDRILGIYDVHIASATVNSGIEAHIDGVDQAVAEKIKNLLLNKIQSPQSGAGVSQSMPMSGATPAVTVGPSAMQFAEVFSSKTYPISSAWVAKTFISSLLSSFVMVVFLLIFLRRLSEFVNGLDIKLIIFSVVLVYLAVYVFTVAGALLWRHFFYFEFLPQFIIVKDGIISREEKHIPYRTIQDVSSRQSILDRMLGIANVRIENAATQVVTTRNGNFNRSGGLVIPGVTVAQAEKIVNALKEVLTKTVSQSTGL